MDKTDKIARYFNSTACEYAARYEAVTDVSSFIFNERKRLIFEMFELERGRVLDVGCGPGVYTDRLSEAGLDVYGIDYSGEMIEIAKSKNFKNAVFSVGRADNLKFEDNFFDSVLCVGVLEYIDDLREAIREIARVTRKGGTAIFTAPIRESLLNRLDASLRNLLRVCAMGRFINQSYQARLISGRDLVSALEKSGFRVEEKRFHIFRLTFLNKLWPRLALAVAKEMNFVSGPLFSANCIFRCRKE